MEWMGHLRLNPGDKQGQTPHFYPTTNFRLKLHCYMRKKQVKKLIQIDSIREKMGASC